MEVLTVGGGLYGIAAALALDRAGHDVTLFEKEPRLMRGASTANQLRLHRGYHYPRSEPTARECRESERRFAETFPDAVLDDADSFYCIASEGSRTTAREFLDHCDHLELPYEETAHPTASSGAIDLCVRVPEARVDPHALRQLCLDRLRESDVRVVRNRRATPEDVAASPATVLATYAHLNELVGEHSRLRRRHKFELCEKPLVTLPPAFDGTSTVVMDGPFMCYDPYGGSDRFLLGNVVHAVHDRSIGIRPTCVDGYEDLLYEGLVRAPTPTHIERFRDHGERFLPGLAAAEHHGSFFSLRTVLADVEESDARPTLVDREGSVVTVLAGKLASCLAAADEVVAEVAAIDVDP